jgi:D-hexose-6-phosphate mutarotase
MYVQPDDGFVKPKPWWLNNKKEHKEKLAVTGYLFEEE